MDWVLHAEALVWGVTGRLLALISAGVQDNTPSFRMTYYMVKDSFLWTNLTYFSASSDLDAGEI